MLSQNQKLYIGPFIIPFQCTLFSIFGETVSSLLLSHILQSPMALF